MKIDIIALHKLRGLYLIFCHILRLVSVSVAVRSESEPVQERINNKFYNPIKIKIPQTIEFI